jgi:hypothetical protein
VSPLGRVRARARPAPLRSAAVVDVAAEELLPAVSAEILGRDAGASTQRTGNGRRTRAGRRPT